MQTLDLRLGQQADERHRLAQPRGRVVAPQHCREKLAVVTAPGDVAPFVVRRHPSALLPPTVQVGQDLGANLRRRKIPHDGERNGPLQLIQRLRRQAALSTRTHAFVGDLKLVALADTPRLEDRPRQNHAQRVADFANADFHSDIITSYNLRCKRGAARNPFLDEPLAVRPIALTEGSFRVAETPVNKPPQGRRLRSGRCLHHHAHSLKFFLRESTVFPIRQKSALLISKANLGERGAIPAKPLPSFTPCDITSPSSLIV